MKKIPFYIKEKPSVGTWNTSKTKRDYKFNPEIRQSWWYDFIPTITDEEFDELENIFLKLDRDPKDKSKRGQGTIELNELIEINVNRKRTLNKDSMTVLQPEFEKFLARIEEKKLEAKEAKKYSGKNVNEPLKMSVETCKNMMNAFGWINTQHVSLYEFLAMMQYVQMAICVFQLYDFDGNSTMDPEEMVEAMDFFGYKLRTKDTKKFIELLGKKRFLCETKVHRTEFVSICSLIASIRTEYQRSVLKNSKFAFEHKLFSEYLIQCLDKMK